MSKTALTQIIATNPELASKILLWRSCGLIVRMFLLRMALARGAP